jgi:MYXO-CTERM domain-containing protein
VGLLLIFSTLSPTAGFLLLALFGSGGRRRTRSLLSAFGVLPSCPISFIIFVVALKIKNEWKNAQKNPIYITF